MQNLMNWLLFILILTVILELLYIILLRKGIENIGRDFSNKLNDDTNTALTVSFPDKGLKKFALLINKELKTLRNEKLKLEQGNMELNKAITNIAHDLRTPLAAIKGYLELLETAADEKKKERYLSVIAERTEALNALMEELFQYSVVTTSNKSLEMEELSLNSELEIALAGAYGMLSARGINPVIEIPDIAVKRKLSHEALQRIFDNILVNSAKYSDGDLMVLLKDDGEIIFKNKASSLSNVENDKLFDRFYTVENARGSSGLGLSIARELTEKMGGTIRSEINEGVLSIILIFNN